MYTAQRLIIKVEPDGGKFSSFRVEVRKQLISWSTGAAYNLP